MTIKQFQYLKLAVVVIIAILASQAIVYKIYLLPVAALVVASLLLIFLRRRVTGIMADERDYATAGKAALWAMQIYAWVAVIAMFVLYGLRDLNPSYEPMAMTLAFSTCLLLLMYAVIFRYYQKFSLGDKKIIYIVLAVILFLIIAMAALRIFSGEDNWICQNGQWIKHGQPSFPPPAVECNK